MSVFTNKKIIISGLVSSKINLEAFLVAIRDEIKKHNGEIVAELIQRRGVSRSNKPGGSDKLDLPLNAKTYATNFPSILFSL